MRLLAAADIAYACPESAMDIAKSEAIPLINVRSRSRSFRFGLRIMNKKDWVNKTDCKQNRKNLADKQMKCKEKRRKESANSKILIAIIFNRRRPCVND